MGRSEARGRGKHGGKMEGNKGREREIRFFLTFCFLFSDVNILTML